MAELPAKSTQEIEVASNDEGGSMIQGMTVWETYGIGSLSSRLAAAHEDSGCSKSEHSIVEFDLSVLTSPTAQCVL